MSCDKFNRWAKCSVFGRLTITVIASCIITVFFAAIIWIAQRLGLIEIVKTTTENSIILVFVGFLAGFIVLNNFQQVEDIKKDIYQKIAAIEKSKKSLQSMTERLESIELMTVAHQIAASINNPINVTLGTPNNEGDTVFNKSCTIIGCKVKYSDNFKRNIVLIETQEDQNNPKNIGIRRLDYYVSISWKQHNIYNMNQLNNILIGIINSKNTKTYHDFNSLQPLNIPSPID